MSASIHTTTSVASPIASSNVYNPDHSVAQSGGSGPGSTIGGVSEFWPLPPQIARNLNDRMYEKRKQAALEIEKLVRSWLSTEPPTQSKAYVAQLIRILDQQYLYHNSNPHTRKGGLIGLAATAIALGYKEVNTHLACLLGPVIGCLKDADPRVRYYGCEALFNISKVARGLIMGHVGQIFENLCDLAADEDGNVRNGTELLDKLMQDTVAEHVDRFEVQRFLPPLTQRLKSNNPKVALFLVKWMISLNSRPNSNLLNYLPQLLEGLFGFLALDDEVLFKETEECLREFLNEIKERPETVQYAAMVNTLVYHSKRNQMRVQKVALVWMCEFVKCAGRQLLPFLSNMLQAILPILSLSGESHAHLVTLAAEVNLELQELITEADDSAPTGLSAGGANRMGGYGMGGSSLQVITNSNNPVGVGGQNTGVNANQSNVAESLTSVSSSSIDDPDSIDQIRPRTGGGAMDTNGPPTLITFSGMGVDSHHPPPSNRSTGHSSANATNPPHPHQPPVHPVVVHLDVRDTVDTLAQLISQNHNSIKTIPTQEACLDWLFKLYSTVPYKMFVCTESIFPTLILLVRTPPAERESQPSSVHHKTLKVLAEIASSPAAPMEPSSLDITCPSQRNIYFRSLLRRLLESFSAFPELTDIDRCHGLFIIRNLCALLSARDVYRTLSEILLSKTQEERPFVSKMVNLLNTILMTTHELFHLRDELKHFKLPDTRDLFCCVYRTWCLCPVAAVSLCLLSGKYRHACRLLHLFGSLEIDVDILNEVDKLVQLLESPIFANLRLQMLEMSDSEQPHLVKAMYSLLMLLPQTAAYSLLRDRLSCIPSPQLMPTTTFTTTATHYPLPSSRKAGLQENREGIDGNDAAAGDEVVPNLNGPVSDSEAPLHKSQLSPASVDSSRRDYQPEDIDSDALLDDFRAVNVSQDGTPNSLYSRHDALCRPNPIQNNQRSAVGGLQYSSSSVAAASSQHQQAHHMNYFKPLLQSSLSSSQHANDPNAPHPHHPNQQQGSTTISDV
ncbi:protein VAC14 homolog isoform X2 [Convolutriloba macropyga]|uniref:protein VAC14 homolog isoform X2 n=1 Tax=Convolutriloba macropyga TaxID=536237 RepID=UPI003F526648